jgi:hypothetical protein
MRRIPAEWQKFRQKFNPQTAEPVPLGKRHPELARALRPSEVIPDAEVDRHNHTKPSALAFSPFPCAAASVNEPYWSREVVSTIHGLLAESQVMSKEKRPGFLRRLFGGKPASDAPSRKATEKTAEVRNQKVEAASAAAPPPAGPAAPPGVRAPDERKPGTRKKGTPED